MQVLNHSVCAACTPHKRIWGAGNPSQHAWSTSDARHGGNCFVPGAAYLSGGRQPPRGRAGQSVALSWMIHRFPRGWHLLCMYPPKKNE